MNKRKTHSNIRRNLSHKRGITRRKSDLNSMYSEGFIRRMSAPLHLIPISENDERVIRHRQLYPPETRTDDESGRVVVVIPRSIRASAKTDTARAGLDLTDGFL